MSARLVPLLLAPLFVSLALPSPARAEERTTLFVDRDDDDADRVPDADQAVVPSGSELFTLPVPKGAGGSFTLRGDAVRLLAEGVPLAKGASIPQGPKRLEVQATRPGRAEVDVFGVTRRFSALEIRAVDGQGREVDLARSQASIQRTPPERLGDDPFANSGDPDALRFVVIGLGDDLPGTISLASLSPSGVLLDALRDLPLGEVACPTGVPAGMVCGSTRPIRAAADDLDRRHPLVADRSMKAELGGALVVLGPNGEKGQMIRVAGPRRSALGPIERYRAKIKMLLVRLSPKGPAPVGHDDAMALGVARAELERSNAIWGACGISLGPPAELDVAIVDPPPPHLLAVGCDHGLPASGGRLEVRVDGRSVGVSLEPGLRPAAAARVMADAIQRAGFEARVSDNPAISAGAFGSSDVLVRRKGGALATLSPPASGKLTTDASLTACIGRVDLEDGLQHFGDVDAIAGTVEERALIKAFDDGGPETIRVFLVPSFAGGGRIGESFISADGGSVRNVLFLDRAAVRADRASFALAHELGHVLLDDPGHPDDFGVDTPTRLMDADAANPTAFGPRRLIVDECVRALRQSGPGAPVPLLRRWPLGRLGNK